MRLIQPRGFLEGGGRRDEAVKKEKFGKGGRSGVITDIEKALPHLDDSDMVELCHRVIGKLQGMTDGEFERLELTEAEE